MPICTCRQISHIHEALIHHASHYPGVKNVFLSGLDEDDPVLVETDDVINNVFAFVDAGSVQDAAFH